MTASPKDSAISDLESSATRDASPQYPPLAGPALIIVSILLGLANAVAVLDITIANVSLPHIAGSFGVTTHEATWVITSYAIAEAVTVVLTGWLVGRFGTVKVFVATVSGFGLFSLLCGLAPTFDVLVPMRVLQGLSGGPMIPLTQTLLLQIYPKGKAGAAMGVWALGSVCGPVLGPILGGYICDNASWPWIFFINVPFTVVAGVLCWRVLRHRETPILRTQIDFVGLVLLILWVASLQILLEKGREFDWFASSFIVGLAIVAIIAFGAFLIWELTDEHPIVDLRVFATPGFGLSVAILCTVFGGFFANEVLSPLWMQTNLGYTATSAGLAACPHAIVIIFMAPIVQKIMPRIDNRILICLGLLLLAASTAWKATFASNVTFWMLFFVQGSMGIGLALMFLPIMPAVLGTLKPGDVAAGAGLMNFCRTTSMAFAAAIVTSTWNDAATENRVALINQMPGVDSLAALGIPKAQQPFMLDALVQDQSVMLATVQIYGVLVVIMVIAAMSIWLIPRPSPDGAAPMGGH